MTETRCRAKNRTTCWRHGEGLGYDANREIRVTLKKKVIHTPHEIFMQALKTYDSPHLASVVSSFAAQKEGVSHPLMADAIRFASDLHKTDTRANRAHHPRTAYIEHPLQNTLRVIRYGCTRQHILIATLLHDTVEDHAWDIARSYAKQEPNDEADARRISYEYIEHKFGKDVARVVKGMSNPIVDDKYLPAAQKNLIYRDHVIEAVEDPEVLVSKVSDFTDNALSLHHTESTMTATSLYKKATKYLLVIDHLTGALKKHYMKKTLPVADYGFNNMMRQLEEGKARLIRIRDQYKPE